MALNDDESFTNEMTACFTPEAADKLKNLSPKLKKEIREGHGTEIDLASGVSCLIVASEKIRPEKAPYINTIQVRRITRSSFMVNLVTSDEEVMEKDISDELYEEASTSLTKIYLDILEAQLMAGQLEMVDSDEMERRLTELAEEGNRAVAELKQRLNKKP